MIETKADGPQTECATQGALQPKKTLEVMSQATRARLMEFVQEHYARELALGSIRLELTGFDRGLLVGIEENSRVAVERHFDLIFVLARTESIVLYDIDRWGEMLVLNLQVRAS